MYNPKSKQADEFINHEEIMDTLAYAHANRANRELISQILEKAKERKGLSHREAAVLLDCELEDKNQEIYALAEQIKKVFFQAGFCYELKISTNKGEDIFLDKWKLSFCAEGRDGSSARQFENISRQAEICLYLHEIEELLRPEIYGLMERFLDQKFENGQLAEYEMIKLTGQSCKSRLFLEALKQYVPGKGSRASGGTTQGRN